MPCGWVPKSKVLKGGHCTELTLKTSGLEHDSRQCFLNCVPSSLSKHLPSPDTMSFNVDVDALENSHGATYVRKKAAKVVGENLPKEQG